MTTQLGKELRKLRIDHSERLLDMANKIGKSASFISAVEIGKKSPPQGFEDIIARMYSLTTDAFERMRSAADQARTSFSIHASSPLARDTAGLLARKIDTLSDDQLQEIKLILFKDGDDHNAQQ